jgi:hypothetical protein
MIDHLHDGAVDAVRDSARNSPSMTIPIDETDEYATSFFTSPVFFHHEVHRRQRP